MCAASCSASPPSHSHPPNHPYCQNAPVGADDIACLFFPSNRHACGVDDDALTRFLFLFLMPVTLSEQYWVTLAERRRSQSGGKKKFRFRNKLMSLDGSIIDLSVSMFDWAKYKRTKGAIKLHLLLDHDGYLPSFAVVTEGKTSEIKVARTLRFDPGTILAIDRGYVDYEWFRELTMEEVYFVTRMKENAVYEVKEECQLPKNSNVVEDQIICFPRLARADEEPVLFRRVEILDKETQKTIVFLSNLLAFGATTIAAIYKDRWQVELFFKALKQTLKIKTFVGTSANAVRTQVWTALIAMLVLKYLQLKSTFNWSLSNLAALLRQQLFFYRDLYVWLNDPFQSPPALAGVHDDLQQLLITW
jgi:hypothetical protein